MEARDLRIGNFVHDNKYAIDLTIGSLLIHEWSAHEKEMLMTYPPKPFFEPIPLTTQWLSKFGFLWNAPVDWFELIDWMPYVIVAYKNTQDIPMFRLTTFKKDWNLCEFRYVHQLQNIYHSLTQKELTIK